jgi:hypothetical protein
MSIGIAMVCGHKKEIVTVTDHKVSFGAFAGDGMVMKFVPLFPKWFVVYAGNDPEFAPRIINIAKKRFSEGTAREPEEIAELFDDAYAEFTSSYIEKKVLRKYKYTAERFINEGRKKCSPDLYRSLCAQIEKATVSLEFLLCGFDQAGKGHIFGIDGKSAPACYDHIGVWAVGQGHDSAMNTLAFYSHHHAMKYHYVSRAEAIYCALSAKFMAESADGVGEDTFISAFSASGDDVLLLSSSPLIAPLRMAWKTYGAPRISQEVMRMFPGVIMEHKREDEAYKKMLAKKAKSGKGKAAGAK